MIRHAHCDYNHPHISTNAHNLYAITNHPYIWTLPHVSAINRHPLYSRLPDDGGTSLKKCCRIHVYRSLLILHKSCAFVAVYGDYSYTFLSASTLCRKNVNILHTHTHTLQQKHRELFLVQRVHCDQNCASGSLQVKRAHLRSSCDTHRNCAQQPDDQRALSSITVACFLTSSFSFEMRSQKKRGGGQSLVTELQGGLTWPHTWCGGNLKDITVAKGFMQEIEDHISCLCVWPGSIVHKPLCTHQHANSKQLRYGTVVLPCHFIIWSFSCDNTANHQHYLAMLRHKLIYVASKFVGFN